MKLTIDSIEEHCKHFVPIQLYQGNVIKAIEWCEEHTSTGLYFNAYEGWFFEYANDALLFFLRWGQSDGIRDL